MTELNKTQQNLSSKFPERSTGKMILFQLHIIVSGLLFSMWQQIQFFAVSLLLIPQFVITIIYLTYSIVDGSNDPIIGYLCDKSSRFTARYGKRFPWIMIGIIFGPAILILCFVPVTEIRVIFGQVINPDAVLIAAMWLIVTICVYESFMTLYEINLNALFPDLFRGIKQRIKISEIGLIMGAIASVIGVVITIFLAVLGGVESLTAYIGTVILVVLIAYALLIPMSRGIREPEDMKSFRTELDKMGKSSSPVREVVVRVFKDRNWMAFTLAFFTYTVAGMCLSAGVNFFIVYNLGLGISSVIIPQLGGLICGLIAIPIFSRITRKYGAKKGYLISLTLLATFFFSFFFVKDIIGVFITFSIVGVGLSSQGYMFAIVASEAIDNAVVQSGKREEGTYTGILRIFSGFCYFIQALIFALVSSITGFNPAFRSGLAIFQSGLAKFGLNLQMSLIPLVIIAIGIIIFAFRYNITKEKAKANRIKLFQMKL